MANSFFRFKQFTVNQEKAAMKVGTDGVLLGAWAGCDNARKILDIGTGSGLIALMMAQRNPNAEIIAIEIDEDACEQANQNFKTSPWSDRLSVVHTSLQDYCYTANKFDLIVSNPPFFNNSLKSSDQARNKARHTDSLSYEELFYCSHQLSEEDAALSFIIPSVSEKEVIRIKNDYDYNLSRVMRVQGDINKQIVRTLFEFKTKPVSSISKKNICIEKGRRHLYSEEYIALTKDFYLAF
nr:methyltransferase [uncultured Carboxylicivirga sp.]